VQRVLLVLVHLHLVTAVYHYVAPGLPNIVRARFSDGCREPVLPSNTAGKHAAAGVAVVAQIIYYSKKSDVVGVDNGKADGGIQ